MANIVGLQPTQDQLNATGQQQVRPAMELHDGQDLIKPVSFQPVATPVETYAHPQQAPINHDYENLIQGLSTLNGALDGYKSATAKSGKKEKVEIDRDDLTRNAQAAGAEGIGALIDSAPNKETAKFYGEQRAAILGDRDAQTAQEWFNTHADKQNADVQGELHNMLLQRMKTDFGGNPAGMDAYNTRLAGVARTLTQQQLEFRKQNNDMAVSQNTQDGFTAILRNAVDSGYPSTMVTNETARYFNNTKALAGFTYKEQSQKAIQAVDPLLTDMQQNPQKAAQIMDTVQAVFEGSRVDPKDGQSRRIVDLPDGVGDAAKAKLAKFREAYQGIMKTNTDASVAATKYNAEKHPELVSDDQLVKLRDSGVISGPQYQDLLITRQKANDKNAQANAELDAKNLEQTHADLQTAQDYERAKNYDLFDPKDVKLPTKDVWLKKDPNATKTLTAAERWQNVVGAREKDNEYELNQRVNKGESPEAVKADIAGKDVTFYSRAGKAPKQWGDDAKAAVNGLTTMTEQSASVPQQALDQFQKFKMLQSQGRNLIDAVYGDREKEIFGVAAGMPGDPAQNLQAAARAYGNRDVKTDEVVSKDVRAAVEKSQRGGVAYVKSIFGGEYPDNYGLLQNDVEKRAKAYVKAYNMSADDATAQALQDSAGNYISINNRLVKTQKGFPSNTGELVKNYFNHLDKLVGHDKFGADSVNDLTLADGPNGTYQIISKKHGYSFGKDAIMIEDGDGNKYDARYITPQILGVIANDDRAKQEIRATREGEERLKPLFVIPGTTVGMSKPNFKGLLPGGQGYTPGEIKTINENIDKAAGDTGVYARKANEMNDAALETRRRANEGLEVIRKATPSLKQTR
jgi:hypothetical protein